MKEPANSPHNTVHCEGWWQQYGMGRQAMEGLEIMFAAGQLQGTGYDVIGAFQLRGTVDESGGVAIVKQYLGQHRVDYLGQYDGEGTLQGEWRIGYDRGEWLIRIARSQEATSREVAQWMPGQ